QVARRASKCCRAPQFSEQLRRRISGSHTTPPDPRLRLQVLLSLDLDGEFAGRQRQRPFRQTFGDPGKSAVDGLPVSEANGENDRPREANHSDPQASLTEFTRNRGELEFEKFGQ